MKNKIIYPLSADPITSGHVDIIERIINLFPNDEIDIVIANNEKKKHLFSIQERLWIARSSCINLDRKVNIISYDGILSDYANNNNSTIMVRGIRNSTDFDYEINLEQFTRETSNLETIYLSPYTKHLNTSSSLVRNFILSGHMDKSHKFMEVNGFNKMKEILSNR
jgi:pantetheine-phosphate adenylyltransferase